MNERIKELALQAGYLPDMFGIGHWDMPECIRFAELVRQDEREVNENFEKMLFDMQNAAINLAKVNQELVEALEMMTDRFLDTEGKYGSYEQEAIDLAHAALAKARGTE